VSSATDERREQFKRYKEDVETRGKAFHPYAMFHDTVMSLVVVTVIVGLACVWYFTADEASEPDGASTVGIPTIALILLLALPFLDRRQERRLSRRPVAVIAAILTVVTMGVLTYKGAVAEEGTGATGDVARWIEENNIPEGEAQEGAQLFAESGCTNCHTYLGSGVANLGAPELSGVGNEMDAARLQAYISNPREFGNQVMPVYGETLSEEQLGQIAAFLEASKGSSGG
jgi:menaquinol-cytochrome c reductase cytochrome b/c subunit